MYTTRARRVKRDINRGSTNPNGIGFRCRRSDGLIVVVENETARLARGSATVSVATGYLFYTVGIV